jgi:hypothetical protein
MSNKLNHTAIAKKMGALQGKNFKLASVTKIRHIEMAEELPVYDTVRRWLEVQNVEMFEGVSPVEVLRELIEQSAKMITGTSQESESASNKIESILR